MKAPALRFIFFLALVMLLPGFILAQGTKVYNEFKTIEDPDGVVYTYNMTGDIKYADPRIPVPADVLAKCPAATKDYISYAILHQIVRSNDLRDSALKIIKTADRTFFSSSLRGNPCTIGNEITFGTGYYTFCPPYKRGAPANDLQFQGSASPSRQFAYQVHINTRDNKIFVVEKVDGKVAEINETFIGKVIFEKDYESEYEKPVPKPPRDLECEFEPPLLPPVAILQADKTSGKAPLEVKFNGESSHDNDQDSQVIKRYLWDFADGDMSMEENPGHTFGDAGEYEVKLTVFDNEGDSASTTKTIVVSPGEVKPDPEPTPCDTCDTPETLVPPTSNTCFMMYYRIQRCEGRVDTLEKEAIRVPCPAPPVPKVVETTCCCGTSTVMLAPEDTSRIELAGGTVFKRYRGQLSEYSLGATGQIRYRFGENRRWAGIVDLSVQPLRKATPLDDRPFRWSDLRDSIDTETGLPLVWFRGTERATANIALGAEFKPWRRIFMQGMFGQSLTFQQKEASDPRKDPFNQFKGFDPEVFYGEFRIGVRSTHLEIFFAYQLLQQNEPFTRIPANNQGGTFTPRSDKSYNVGIQILW